MCIKFAMQKGLNKAVRELTLQNVASTLPGSIIMHAATYTIHCTGDAVRRYCKDAKISLSETLCTVPSLNDLRARVDCVDSS